MKRYIYILIILALSINIFAAPPKRKGQTQKKKRVIEKLETGHFFQMAAGGGVSSLQYDLRGGQTHLYPSLNLHFGYTYYFNKYAGINTGLQYTTYATRAVMTDPLEWNGMTDYMGEQYTHYTRFNGWQERQSIHSLEIPLALALKYKPQNVGLYATLGVKLGVAVDQHYKNTRGTVSHSAYYPLWNVTMQDLAGRYETEDYSGTTETLRSVHRINAIGYAEIGTLIELNPHTDLTIGAYADVYINNAGDFNKKEPIELGFATRLNNYGSFMNEYNGLIGSTQAGTVIRPWSAGLKIGISITPQRTDKEKERTAKRLYRKYKKYMPECENEILHDTVYMHDTVFIPCMECALQYIERQKHIEDSIRQTEASEIEIIEKVETPEYSELTKQQSRRLDNMLQGAVIWFHFDEYVPILQPEYILDSVADMLKTNSELRVHVNGHACSIGSDSYNQRLALKRANAVADLMIKKGVAKEQLKVASFGATEPFRYNGKHQLSTDRRVEIIPEIYSDSIIVREPKTDGRTALYTKFIGEEKTTEGMSLSNLARKWYNQREYWVYIYEANADAISNPNDIPTGITIMIPDLNASLADKSEAERLHHAKQLEAVYKNL